MSTSPWPLVVKCLKISVPTIELTDDWKISAHILAILLHRVLIELSSVPLTDVTPSALSSLSSFCSYASTTKMSFPIHLLHVPVHVLVFLNEPYSLLIISAHHNLINMFCRFSLTICSTSTNTPLPASFLVLVRFKIPVPYINK